MSRSRRRASSVYRVCDAVRANRERRRIRGNEDARRSLRSSLRDAATIASIRSRSRRPIGSPVEERSRRESAIAEAVDRLDVELGMRCLRRRP